MVNTRAPGRAADYVLELSDRTLVLTRAQVDAANLKVRRAQSRNRPVDSAVEAIAAAKPRPREAHAIASSASAGATARSNPVTRLLDEGVVKDRSGAEIGMVGQVYLDDQSGEPEWVTVKIGILGGSESFVPLREASSWGSEIVVPYSRSTIKNAPSVDEGEHLSPEQEQELYRYYGSDRDSESQVDMVVTRPPESGKSASPFDLDEVVLEEERVTVEEVRIEPDARDRY